MTANNASYTGHGEGDRLREVASQYREEFDWADVDAIEMHSRLAAAMAAVSASTQRLLSKLGQKRGPGRFGTLRAIYFAPRQRLTQTEIGDHMNVAPPNVSYIVDSLEGEGLVIRVTEPENRRKTWVELTPAGIEVCRELLPAMTAHMGQLAEGFTSEEKALFNVFLARLQRTAEISQRDM